VDESRHYKNLYLKVCQIPYKDGQTDHHEAVAAFIWKDSYVYPDIFGRTPLLNAVNAGDQLQVFLILHHAKDKSTHVDPQIMTPLHLVACHGDLVIAKMLLEHANDKNPADMYGRTPLHKAAQYGLITLVNLLLEHAITITDWVFCRALPWSTTSCLQLIKAVSMKV
jgi:hypothetical protein